LGIEVAKSKYGAMTYQTPDIMYVIYEARIQTHTQTPDITQTLTHQPW